METASSSGFGAALPRLHLVTDDETLRRPDFADLAAELLRSGGPSVALHLRGRGVSGRALAEAAAALVPVAREAGARLLVNDRVDVAMAARADGAQLGARGMPLRDARLLLGAGALIGASIHSQEEGAIAVADGADLLLAGTLFATPSHPGRPGAGTAWLRRLVALGAPVVGIGGITPERVPGVTATGAHGVAVQRAIWDAPSPAERLRAFLTALVER